MLESVLHRDRNSSCVRAGILAVVLCFSDNVDQKPVLETILCPTLHNHFHNISLKTHYRHSCRDVAADSLSSL